MKTVFHIIVMVLICTSCLKNSNCDYYTNINGKGAKISREYALKDFDALRIYGGIDVHFEQADTFRVAFRAQENIFEHIDLRVEESTLVACPDWEKVNCHFFLNVNHQGMDLTIYAPRLEEIVINGNGDFDIRSGYVSEDGLKLVIDNDSGDVDLSDIHVKTLTIKSDGDGDLYVSGETEEASLTINGDGDVDISNLKVKDTEKRHVQIAGDGDIRL